MSDDDIDEENENQWMEYANNITKLLNDKSELESTQNVVLDNNLSVLQAKWNKFMQNVGMQSMNQNDDNSTDNGIMERIRNSMDDDDDDTEIREKYNFTVMRI